MSEKQPPGNQDLINLWNTWYGGTLKPYVENFQNWGKQTAPPTPSGGFTHGGMTGGNNVNAVRSAGDNTPYGRIQEADGSIWVVNQYGRHLSQVSGPRGAGVNVPYGPGGGGPSWYEQQQIALDKQRIKDAEAAQAAQLAYQHQQQLIAESNAIEAANQAFRDAQLKSTYGTINGMAYASAKGSPFVQLLPEPALIKQGYIDAKQPDPWSQAAPYGGYTGSTYMNAQQPGLYNANDPNMAVPKSGPGSAIPSSQPTLDQIQQWHELAHKLPPMPYSGGTSSSTPSPQLAPGTYQGGPSGPTVTVPPAIPSMASGGMVPGNPGQPQLIMAHGGETIIPAGDRQAPTLATPMDVAMQMVRRDGNVGPIPGYATGGVVPTYGTSPNFSRTDNLPLGTDWGAFTSWHDTLHNSAPWSFQPTINTYGQTTNAHVTHGPQDNDIIAGPGHLNPAPLSPVLTGLSGYGATITPNGTPVVMSNWQRQHLMPSSISGPGGYDDYAMQQAGWSPQDLQQLGNDVTGGFGRDLSAPTHYAPIAIQPAPAGG